MSNTSSPWIHGEKPLFQRTAGRRKGRRGQAMTELILVVPLLILFLGGLCGLGALLFHQVKLCAAAREAALLLSNGEDLSSVRSWVQRTTTGPGLLDLKSAGLSLSVREEASPRGALDATLRWVEMLTGDLNGATAELVYVEPLPVWMSRIFGPVVLRESCTMLQRTWTTRREPR